MEQRRGNNGKKEKKNVAAKKLRRIKVLKRRERELLKGKNYKMKTGR